MPKNKLPGHQYAQFQRSPHSPIQEVNGELLLYTYIYINTILLKHVVEEFAADIYSVLGGHHLMRANKCSYFQHYVRMRWSTTCGNVEIYSIKIYIFPQKNFSSITATLL